MTTPAHTWGSAVLDRLRAETRAEHDAVETALDLTGGRLTAEHYRRVLERLYGFYRPLEDCLDALGGWEERGLALGARRKTLLLETDLAVFGNGPSAPLPVLCRDLPPCSTPVQGFGCLYVLEGATLGGQVISRHVRETLGVTPETGGRFFHGYGDRTREMWQSFRAAVTGVVVSPADQDAAVAAAKATFRNLHRWTAARGESP